MEIINCPQCNCNSFDDFLSVTDFTVSRETFKIVECKRCHLKYTNPRPAEKLLGSYYESETYISHSDTNAGFISKAYKAVRTISLRRKCALINSLGSTHKTILDIGCGTGAFLNTMSEDNWKTTGIEPNDSARAKAVAKYGLTVYEEKFLDEAPIQYDVITLWHVLEHVYHLRKRLNEILQRMHSGSTLVVAVPNCDSSDAKYYQQYWAAYDVPRHLYHFNPSTMESLMDDNGLRVVQKVTMPFDAYYVAMLSEKYKNSKQNLIGAMYQGVLSNLHSVKEVDKCSSIVYIIKLKEH